jgi:hypothetical protein
MLWKDECEGPDGYPSRRLSSSGRSSCITYRELPRGSSVLHDLLYVICCFGLTPSLIIVCADQITVTGGGAASPSLVMFQGAYKAADPGIKINIHAAVATYVVPGPMVYAGGTTKSAGGACVGVKAMTAAPAPSATGETPGTHGARRRHLWALRPVTTDF